MLSSEVQPSIPMERMSPSKPCGRGTGTLRTMTSSLIWATRYRHFAYWLMNKVGLIEIATDNDNYAYAIFETMNDRGKPLSPVDMLKAYLLAPVEDADQRQKANQEWKKQVLD